MQKTRRGSEKTAKKAPFRELFLQHIRVLAAKRRKAASVGFVVLLAALRITLQQLRYGAVAFADEVFAPLAVAFGGGAERIFHAATGKPLCRRHLRQALHRKAVFNLFFPKRRGGVLLLRSGGAVIGFAAAILRRGEILVEHFNLLVIFLSFLVSVSQIFASFNEILRAYGAARSAASAPLCILGKMFVRLCRTTFCV